MVGAAQWREKTAAPDLQPLDQAIHARFNVPEGFGINRIARMPDHLKQPVLSSLAVRQAADDLRSQGWEVNFYLGGRQLLDPKVSFLASPRMQAKQVQEKTYRPLESDQRAWRGPIYLTGHTENHPIANQAEIAGISRQALWAMMEDGSLSKHYDHLGHWVVAAYPVKATKSECIGCHSFTKPRPRIGDTLGVAVYAYRRAP